MSAVRTTKQREEQGLGHRGAMSQGQIAVEGPPGANLLPKNSE